MNQSQIKFALASHATWLVLRNPVLTKLYTRQWRRYINRSTKNINAKQRLWSLYGFIFNLMYKEV